MSEEDADRDAGTASDVDERVYRAIRRAEANYFPCKLRSTLMRAEQWGAVEIAPRRSDALDLTIEGTIVKSDGDTLKLDIDAWDATGRRWLDKTYEVNTTEAQYMDLSRDPYQPVYNSIANDLTEVLSVGQVVEVAVKSLDWEADRFSFSLRATMADPWSKVVSVDTEGSVHNGTVARLLPFGAFVTLEDGVDGLLHISKIGEGRHINHPREVLKEGQPLKVTVDKIDASKRRISLAPAAKGDEEEATADYMGRPQASMGSFGDLLKKAAGDKKKKG